MPCNIGKKLANHMAALPMRAELPRGFKKVAGGCELDFRFIVGEWFAMIAIEHGFLFKGIHMRGAALHEEKNHALSFRGKMWRLGCKRVDNSSFGLVCEQASKGNRAKADCRLFKCFSSIGVVHISFRI